VCHGLWNVGIKSGVLSTVGIGAIVCAIRKNVKSPKMKHLEPAKSIIEKLGGVDTVAGIVGRDITRVYRWMYPAANGGTNGLIPSKFVLGLLDYANRKGIKLEPIEFSNGQPIVIIGKALKSWDGRHRRKPGDSRRAQSKARSVKPKTPSTKKNLPTPAI
jgi:hypothetical protein